MVQQKAASQQGETRSTFGDAIRLECAHVRNHSPGVPPEVDPRDLPLLKMRELVEIAFRSRKFVPGSTVWHRLLCKEGLLTDDWGTLVKVQWDWPEKEPRAVIEDKFHICLCHERREPLQYVLPGVNLSAFLIRFAVSQSS